VGYKVSIAIEKDEHGYYAYAPQLQGCQTQADTLEELLANMKEAVELYSRDPLLGGATAAAEQRGPDDNNGGQDA